MATKFLPSTSFGEQRTKNVHSCLHCVRGKKYLWHKQNSIAEVHAHNAHSFNKCYLQHLVWAPTAVQQNGGAFNNFLAQTVVQVIVHLCHKIFIRKTRKINVVKIAHMYSRY